MNGGVFVFAIVVIAATLLLGVTSASAQLSPSLMSQVRQYANETDVVLRATVHTRKAATHSTESVEQLAVARLEEVISGPAVYRAFVRRDITIHLRDPSAVSERDQRIFFVAPWFFGETIGVIEVGSIRYRPREVVVADISSEVKKVRAQKAERELISKMERASVVAAGRIIAIRAGDVASLSEHDPVWSEADLEISESLRGVPGRIVTILFPASRDVMWYSVPKPGLGQEGIWILDAGLPGVANKEQLGILTAGSLLPSLELPRIRRLLQR